MNTPAQCGAIKPPKTDIYSEAPHSPKSRLDKHRSITVDTIIARSDEILNWHHSDRASNGRIEGTILWSVSEGVVDVADGHVAGCRGRVLWSVSLVSAMLLAV